MQTISIIVPCCNEAAALPLFYDEATRVLSSMPVDYELLFVDDGSRDGTLAEMRRLAAADAHVKYVSFSRNFGKEAAMYAGFCNARGDYAAVMDCDLQHPPALLPQIYELLQEGDCDSVAMRRQDRAGEPVVRSWFAHRFYRLINHISDAQMMDGATDFRLMRREMVDAIVAMGEVNRFSKGIFSWVGFRTRWISAKIPPRAAGTTKWSFWGLVRYAVDGIVNFSQVPLSIASFLGLAMTISSFIMLVTIVVQKLSNVDYFVDGWASTTCIVLFAAGVQLLCLGIMSQYIAKLYLEAKRRPHYIAAESNIEPFDRIR